MNDRPEAPGLRSRLLPDGRVEVFNSADPDTVLVFAAAEWDAFLAGVAVGEFNPEALS